MGAICSLLKIYRAYLHHIALEIMSVLLADNLHNSHKNKIVELLSKFNMANSVAFHFKTECMLSL